MYMHKFQLMIEFGLCGCGGLVLLVTVCTYFIKQTCQHFYRSNSVTAGAGVGGGKSTFVALMQGF